MLVSLLDKKCYLLYDSGCRTRKHLFFLINGFTSLSFSGLLAFKLVGVGFLGDYC